MNCADGVDAIDSNDLLDYVAGVSSLTCRWAGDVNCADGVDAIDSNDLLDYVAGVTQSLDCCEGC